MDGFIHTIEILIWRMKLTEKLMIIRTGITQPIIKIVYFLTKLKNYNTVKHMLNVLKIWFRIKNNKTGLILFLVNNIDHLELA